MSAAPNIFAMRSGTAMPGNWRGMPMPMVPPQATPPQGQPGGPKAMPMRPTGAGPMIASEGAGMIPPQVQPGAQPGGPAGPTGSMPMAPGRMLPPGAMPMRPGMPMSMPMNGQPGTPQMTDPRLQNIFAQRMQMRPQF